MEFETKAVHAGQMAEPTTGALITPIYQTATYVQDFPAQPKNGYVYSRSTNPTRTALEACIASLENARYGLTFSSGMAAIDAVMKLLSPNDEVIAGRDLYGGSYRLFTEIFSKYGIKFHFVDTTDLLEIQKQITSRTKLIWIETPTNPTIQVTDIAATAQIAKANNILLGVDNTFASPYLQNPIVLGADIVMHSATKYLAGHSDLIMGALVTNHEDLYRQLFMIHKTTGSTAAPMDSFLVLRGIKTLHLRMKAHCENAQQVTQFLTQHSRVAKVYWPGLVNHTNHEIAKKQMKNFGGMVSFTLKGDLEDTCKIAASFQLFKLAESLGGVTSLVNHPVTMTHATIPKIEREKNGITDNLLRLSVGIENSNDLIADLEQALNTRTKKIASF